MNEKDTREMLKELYDRHKVPMIESIFYLKPISKTREIITDFGGQITNTIITKASFNENMVTGECWFEFYGLPSEKNVRHEFKHYLDHLGIKYIRKRLGKREAEG